MAAYAAGVRTVLIPADNERNLDEIDPTVREALNFIPCKKASDVLCAALCPAKLSVCKQTKKAEVSSELDILNTAHITEKVKIPAIR